MKRIAVFCDGTWNNRDKMEHATNVGRLAMAVAPKDDYGVEQLSLYFPGVGDGVGRSWLERTIDKWGGGAFGWGLTRNIQWAYERLAKFYEPGDQIFIFGYSRGAYTARSLGGLLRAAGIPAPDQLHRVPEAIARYRSRAPDTAPASDASAAFRWGFSPGVMTGDDEVTWRLKNDKPLGKRLYINYMGVWDTVGALGVPGILGPIAHVLNTGYRFHDHQLSRSTLAARHAIAVDERRVLFKPTLWDNLPQRNDGRWPEPFQQKWFPGDHGIVGGGGPNRGISDQTMMFVAKGAQREGLAFDPALLPGLEDPKGFGGPLFNKKPGGLLALVAKARKGPAGRGNVSDCAVHRLRDGGNDGSRYNPAPLRHLRRTLLEDPQP